MTPLGLTWLRVVVFLLAAAPFARLWILGFLDGLGANPVEFVTRSTGLWTLVFLCVTLAVTPLRKLTGFAWLLRLRRMLGLWAFFYGTVHFGTYLWFDQWFDWRAIWEDVIKRPFITAGFVSLLLMVPLALTSSGSAMRRLGRDWFRLHRLIYPIAIAGVLHFWWHKAGKNDFLEPGIYAGVVALLLGLRLWWWWRGRRA